MDQCQDVTRGCLSTLHRPAPSLSVMYWSCLSCQHPPQVIIRVFCPKPHSGRSANLVLNDRRKKVSFSEIRTLGSCTGVRDYTDWANSPFAEGLKVYNPYVMLYWIQLIHALLNSAKSTKINQVTKVKWWKEQRWIKRCLNQHLPS